LSFRELLFDYILIDYYYDYYDYYGDWGLGIGDWAQSPIPNPQSPRSILSNIII